MADLVRGDVALALDHFGKIPTATVLGRGQRVPRQGFAARNDIETALGAAMASYITGLSGRRMTDESGISLRAAMETPIRRHARAYRAIEANTENILEAARPAGSHFPERHHLGVAANPAWRAEPQRQFRREIEVSPGPQDVEASRVEHVAVVRVDEGDL